MCLMLPLYRMPPLQPLPPSEVPCPQPTEGGGDSGGGDSGSVKALVQLLDLDNPTVLGMIAIPFGWTELTVFYRLFRHLYKSKMYPMNVLDLLTGSKETTIRSAIPPVS